MSLLLTGSLQKPQASAYTETLVTVPQDAHIDLGTANRITSPTQIFMFFSGIITGDNDDREFVVSWSNDAFSHLMLSDPATNPGVDGVFYRMRGDDPANLIEQPLTLLNTRVHVLASSGIDSGTGEITSKAYYKLGGGSWTAVDTGSITTSGNTGTSLSDVSSTSGTFRIFGALANTNRGFAGSAARFAAWVGTGSGLIADPASATVQGWFESGGVTVDPTTAQTNLSGSTRYVDLYGDSSKYTSGDNDGVLGMAVTPGSGFTNA